MYGENPGAGVFSGIQEMIFLKINFWEIKEG